MSAKGDTTIAASTNRRPIKSIGPTESMADCWATKPIPQTRPASSSRMLASVRGIYQGMKGTARITGEKFTVALECDKQKLSLHGQGAVLLTGEGSYKLKQPAKEQQAGSWNAPPSRERHSRPEPVLIGKIEKLEDLVAK